MEYEQFLDIRFSNPDEEGFPTEIAWSLKDGTIKSVLVMPDDDWEPWDQDSNETDVQHLYDHGSSVPDIVRELNIDLDGSTVNIDGLDDDHYWLEKLFDASGQDPSFELGTIKALKQTDLESILKDLNDTSIAHGLDRQTPEENVKAMLMWFYEQ